MLLLYDLLEDSLTFVQQQLVCLVASVSLAPMTQYAPVVYLCVSTGCSGLAVAVREVMRSNHAVGSCIYRKNHCNLQPWARAVCTFPAVPRSTQPSTLHGTVNEYQLSG